MENCVLQTLLSASERPSSTVWAEPVSATAVTLSWTPLQGGEWNGEPIGYLIVYRMANESRAREDGEEPERVRFFFFLSPFKLLRSLEHNPVFGQKKYERTRKSN